MSRRGNFRLRTRKCLRFQRQSRIDQGNIRPPGHDVKIVHERFDAAGKQHIAGHVDKSCKEQYDEREVHLLTITGLFRRRLD